MTMTIGRLIPPFHLGDDERETLERLARRRKTAQAFRARLILACAEGKEIGNISAAFRITRSTGGGNGRRGLSHVVWMACSMSLIRGLPYQTCNLIAPNDPQKTYLSACYKLFA